MHPPQLPGRGEPLRRKAIDFVGFETTLGRICAPHGAPGCSVHKQAAPYRVVFDGVNKKESLTAHKKRRNLP